MVERRERRKRMRIFPKQGKIAFGHDFLWNFSAELLNLCFDVFYLQKNNGKNLLKICSPQKFIIKKSRVMWKSVKFNKIFHEKNNGIIPPSHEN